MLASMAGCTKSTLAVKLQPIDVEVVEVEQRDVSICGQWIGTLDGFVNPNVKAQVTGYLLRQDYKEGSFVEKGQRERSSWRAFSNHLPNGGLGTSTREDVTLDQSPGLSPIIN
jgi:hypothetical protein